MIWRAIAFFHKIIEYDCNHSENIWYMIETGVLTYIIFIENIKRFQPLIESTLMKYFYSKNLFIS